MTSVFKGHEGRLYIGDDVVGRVSTFTVKVDGGVDPTYEIGNRDPCDIKEGNNTYTGTLERAMINGTLLAHTLGYQTLAAGEYTITKNQYINPDTTITGESVGTGAVVYETLYSPLIKGTVVIKDDGVAWGTEGTDYLVDYANGIITFAVPVATGSVWTIDYHYGRSFTLTGVLEVPNSSQRTDVVVYGLLFSTDSITVGNKGETIMELLEFTASGMYALATGEPVEGI